MDSDQVVVSDQSQEPVFCRSCRGTGHVSSECPIPILPSPHAMIEKQTNTYYRGIPSNNSNNAQKNKERREKKLAEKAAKKQVKDEKKKERRMERLESMNKKGGYPKGARIVKYDDSGDEDGLSSRSGPSDSFRSQGDRHRGSGPSDSFRSRGDRHRGSDFRERELVNGYRELRCYRCNQVGHLRRDCHNYGKSAFDRIFKSSERQNKTDGNERRNDRVVERQGREGQRRKSQSQSSSWSTIDGRSPSSSSQVVEIVETEITAFQSDAEWRIQEAEEQIKFMGGKIEKLQEAFRQFQIREEARQLEVSWLKNELKELKSKGGQQKNGKFVQQSKPTHEATRNRQETDPKAVKGVRVRKPGKEASGEARVSMVENKVSSPAAGNVPWDDLIVRKDDLIVRKDENKDDNARGSEENHDIARRKESEEKKSKKKSPFKKDQSEEGTPKEKTPKDETPKDETPKEGKRQRNKYRTKGGESKTSAVKEQPSGEGTKGSETVSVDVQNTS